MLRATSTTRWRIRHAEKFVGTHVVGPREKLPAGKPWTNAPLTVKVPFPAALPSRPVVVACALQDPKHPAPCPDTLALAVISVANTDLTVNIYRTDYAGADDTTSGRGQNPHLPCIAETPA
ncbi:H-type lectin domain protein [Burkholderia sp. MSMB1498]|uniref:H-type lectin domain protein n=1 Tax=Burkholderia sp. MSMB1498 TaxID=1637842 RepID=UPI000A460542|nr:H-type lectin domain protein [Burkholderia sp. MSMB1498]